MLGTGKRACRGGHGQEQGKGSLGHCCLFLGYRTNIATIVIHWAV